MTAPHGPTTTLTPSATGSKPPPPQPPRRAHPRTWTGRTRAALIAGAAVLIVAVIFIVQNAHAANISFLGVHLVLPLAAALLLAALGAALSMIAVGPARITRLRHTIRHALGKARTGA